jgi:hypothetical protein
MDGREINFMWARIKVWFSQLTLGSVIAFSTTAVLFLGQSTAVDWMMNFGLSHNQALAINHWAISIGGLIVWFSRSPKQEPLFTTKSQVDDMPVVQQEAHIIAQADAANIAKKP